MLALTAQAMQGDRERFLAAGFDEYIAKPVDILALVKTVRRLCTGRPWSVEAGGDAAPGRIPTERGYLRAGWK